MTCIVGLIDSDGRAWMGGDSAGVSGYLTGRLPWKCRRRALSWRGKSMPSSTCHGSPNGRGTGLKIRTVWVRCPPVAPCHRSPIGRGGSLRHCALKVRVLPVVPHNYRKGENDDQ